MYGVVEDKTCYVHNATGKQLYLLTCDASGFLPYTGAGI